MTLHLVRVDAAGVRRDSLIVPAAAGFLYNDGNDAFTWRAGGVICKPANQQITSAGWVDIAGLSFPVAANTSYFVEAHLVFQSSLATMGVLLGFSGPASPSLVSLVSRKQTSVVGVASTDMFTEAVIAAYDTANPLSVAEAAGATDLVHTFAGAFVTGPNAGTFTMRMSKENVAGTALVKAGSLLCYMGC